MKSTAVQPDVSQISLLDENDVEVSLGQTYWGEATEEIAEEGMDTTTEFRYMRSVGEQVGIQSDEVERRTRHIQTRLSSIATREIVGINEIRRRALHLGFSSPQHSIRSSPRSSLSNGALAANGDKHRFAERPRFSGRTSEDSLDILEEVNVSVSFVKKPVDEHGLEVIETTKLSEKHQEEDDVFLWESDEDDIESFFVEDSTQTDLEAQHSDSQTIVGGLEGQENVDTQTDQQSSAEGSTQTSDLPTRSDGVQNSSSHTSERSMRSEEVQTAEESPRIMSDVEDQADDDLTPTVRLSEFELTSREC
ncbi:hypothetical protein GCK32_010697 [Trichostrongylus colubriformis]|uniref:Uncharacterized protein n=1 Tax=Trichostrongylus colubriformis TaxID=6319 RepID=A0AAN8G4P9_TRICO